MGPDSGSINLNLKWKVNELCWCPWPTSLLTRNLTVTNLSIFSCSSVVDTSRDKPHHKILSYLAIATNRGMGYERMYFIWPWPPRNSWLLQKEVLAQTGPFSALSVSEILNWEPQGLGSESHWCQHTMKNDYKLLSHRKSTATHPTFYSFYLLLTVLPSIL